MDDFEKGKAMDNAGTLNEALVKYDPYMKGAAYKAARQVHGYFDADDIYQDLFMLLVDVHKEFGTIPSEEFTKVFHTSVFHFIANLITKKRARNRVKISSLDKKMDSESGKDYSSFLERDEQNDESYKVGIMNVLNHVSPESGQAILDSLDPSRRGNVSKGIKEAFKETKEFLTD